MCTCKCTWNIVTYDLQSSEIVLRMYVHVCKFICSNFGNYVAVGTLLPPPSRTSTYITSIYSTLHMRLLRHSLLSDFKLKHQVHHVADYGIITSGTRLSDNSAKIYLLDYTKNITWFIASFFILLLFFCFV